MPFRIRQNTTMSQERGTESSTPSILPVSRFSALFIGNFGDGHINAYNPTSGKFVNKMSNLHGQAIVIDGLWSLRVGSDTTGSANFGPNTVFFTAGPNGEQDGLFGTITSSP